MIRIPYKWMFYCIIGGLAYLLLCTCIVWLSIRYVRNQANLLNKNLLLLETCEAQRHQAESINETIAKEFQRQSLAMDNLKQVHKALKTKVNKKTYTKKRK